MGRAAGGRGHVHGDTGTWRGLGTEERKASGWFHPCLSLPRPCLGSSHAWSHSFPGKEGLVSHFPGQKTEGKARLPPDHHTAGGGRRGFDPSLTRLQSWEFPLWRNDSEWEGVTPTHCHHQTHSIHSSAPAAPESSSSPVRLQPSLVRRQLESNPPSAVSSSPFLRAAPTL